MRIEVRVVPNSKEFLIKKQDEGFKIYLKSKAEKGKANRVLVKEFTKILKKNVSIVHGLKSNKKVIEIEGEERDVLESIKNKCRG